MTGRPLAMLAALVAAWIAGRATLWENPLGAPAAPIVPALAEPRAQEPGRKRAIREAGETVRVAATSVPADPGDAARFDAVVPARAFRGPVARSTPIRIDPARPRRTRVLAHQHLFTAAMRATFPPASLARRGAGEGADLPPFAPPTRPPERARGVPADASPARARAPAAARPDRWSLDAWAFWREGSAGAPVSQGRVPIYGASQLGANLQWRARPSSPHDPRAYARAYRALAGTSETELALGVSARPLPGLPVRVAGELRAFDGPFGSEARPGALAVTEFAPLRLPYDLALEAYAQAGYVGGEASTAFADGQLALTREVVSFAASPSGPMRLSIGGGAWGGAQAGVSRLDIGPTVRLDLDVGEVPARVSLDWRERVGGDAAPSSGVAATLSTRF